PSAQEAAFGNAHFLRSCRKNFTPMQMCRTRLPDCGVRLSSNAMRVPGAAPPFPAQHPRVAYGPCFLHFTPTLYRLFFFERPCFVVDQGVIGGMQDQTTCPVP